MKTLNEIRSEIIKEIHDTLTDKGYNTAEPIDLNPDDVFNQQVSDHLDRLNADYHYNIEVATIESDKYGLEITGTYDVHTVVSRRMSELSIEQLYELYNSVKKLPNCDVED